MTEQSATIVWLLLAPAQRPVRVRGADAFRAIEHEDALAHASWDPAEQGLQAGERLSGLTADRRTVSDSSAFLRL